MNNLWNDKDILIDEKNEEKYNVKKRRELLKAENRRREHELLEIKMSNRSFSNSFKKMTTTKIFAYFIIINCTLVEFYSMWIMYKLQDLSALYSLIGSVIGESITYTIYCAKSFKDTNAEESLKFEREKIGMNDSSENEELTGLVEDDIPEDDDHSHSGDIPEGETEFNEF